MSNHEKVNYLEIPCRDIPAAKAFFADVFSWKFTDYGPDYTAGSNAGIDVGFTKSEFSASTEKGSVLIVFYSASIMKTQGKIESAGGAIVKPLFSFPGGRRFHFSDPSGNEYAVWSDLDG